MKSFIFSIFLMIVLLDGCGSSGGSTTSVTTTTPSNVTGKFIDSPVQGLTYTCSSGTSGETNSNGEYICHLGDNVTFAIGSLTVGTISARTAAVTPYSLFPNNNNAAINFARLLQSIDTGVTNGMIVINTALEAKIPNNTDFANSSFETDINHALGVTLVAPSVAQSIMNEAITIAGGSVPTGSNNIPVANAGVDQNINTTSNVTLNGSKSSDANSDTLTYSWSITSKPSGSNASLSSATIVNPTFTADIDGSYIVQLIVNDGTVNSAADTVTINAATANSAPVANAGVDQNINTTSNVTLNGSKSSDANSDTLTYSWSITSKPSGSNASLSSATIVNPTFTADIDGSYIVQLIVNDGTVNSAADTVTINAIVAAAVAVANKSFANDVMPILNLCAGCHYSGSGRIFQVSNTAGTYTNIQQLINITTPENSLLLQKGSAQISHDGGAALRTWTNYNTIRDWISQGAKNQ